MPNRSRNDSALATASFRQRPLQRAARDRKSWQRAAVVRRRARTGRDRRGPPCQTGRGTTAPWRRRPSGKGRYSARQEIGRAGNALPLSAGELARVEIAAVLHAKPVEERQRLGDGVLPAKAATARGKFQISQNGTMLEQRIVLDRKSTRLNSSHLG